jgi:hypothetical protein
METLPQILYTNAIKILATERRSARRIDEAYRILVRRNLNAGLEDWLYNPFVKTALSILEKFSGNYKIKEALKLLQAAGDEAEKANKPGRKQKKK